MKAGVIVVPCAVHAVVATAVGIKLLGVAQLKPMHRFSPNFTVCLVLIRFWQYLATTIAMVILIKFLGLKVCGCCTA